MQKNMLQFVLCTTAFLFIWFMFFQPKQNSQQTLVQEQTTTQTKEADNGKKVNITDKVSKNNVVLNKENVPEEEITIETEKYKVVFSNKGAAIRHWYIKERNNSLVDLVLPEAGPVLANFPGSVYKIVEKTDNKVVFSYTSIENWKITKTFDLSKDYLHAVDIKLEKLTQDAKLPEIEFNWGPGLGTDDKELKENISVTRIIGFTLTKPSDTSGIEITKNN